MAWRCRFLTARRSQDGRVIAEKWAPDALVDFHTGIDRLTMFLTNKNSIREVLLFPAMKPEASPPPPPPPGDDADAKIRALCAQVAQFGVKPCCGP